MVEEARQSFARERTTERRGLMNEAKQRLFNTYDKIKWEELMEKVRRVEAAQGEQRNIKLSFFYATYVDILLKDVGTKSAGELARCMEDREDWKHRWRTRPRTT
ncbi:unnamed protein product [Boreogadus saida]